MRTTPSLWRSARFAALGLAIAGLGARGVAQPPVVPNAPTVPVAPTLSDNAVIREPLQPAASQEIIAERPSPQHVWIAGHWRWQDGRYAWIAGRWDLPPRPGVVWVEPRWEQRGTGYVLAGGYWQATAPVAPAIVTAPPPPAPGVATSAPPTVVVVDQPPPPPVPEVIVERPSPLHIWIGGYWGWRAGRHVWIGGHWELPPRERAEWVGPHWEHRSNGYVFIEGFWRDVGVSVGVSLGGPGPAFVIREAPPPPRRERYSERDRPSPRHIWIAGYWRHDGRAYLWMPGHWDLPPRGYREWVEPRWENRGGAYVFIEGHWH
jgi:hypothetical protein